MANVIKTVMTYPLNGSTREFNIPFEYLARKFVQVTLIGVDRKVLVLNTDYRFATKTTIATTQAWGPAQGYQQIEIRRYTSATERLVDFTDGSILRAYDLNISQIQTMHVAEEARDLTADTIGVNNAGHLDARGRRIVNLANAVDDRDAVPFGQLKTMNQNAYDSMNKALQYRNEAEQFKNTASAQATVATTKRNEAEQFRTQAQGFRNEAEQFKNTAGASQVAASASQVAAKTSETNAKAYESNAKVQADRATTEANRAKSEADKLSNWNNLAGAVGGVAGNDVRWKGIQTSEQMYRVTSSRGAAGYVNQLNADAPFVSLLPGKQDSSLFYPIIKQNGSTSAGKNTVLSIGMTAQTADDHHLGTVLMATESGNKEWHFKANGDFDVPKGGIATNGNLTVGGTIGSKRTIVSSSAHAAFTADAPSATDPTYVLGKAGGTNNWFVGKGGTSDDVYLQSYKHGTNMILQSDRITINKPLYVGAARIGGDGNIAGTAWGDNLKNWILTYFKKKTKAWTSVWTGNAGGGTSGNLSQDIRFRTIWISANGYWHPANIGPDGMYMISGWGSGWIKFQVYNNGRSFKNVEDSNTIPKQIVVENE